MMDPLENWFFGEEKDSEEFMEKSHSKIYSQLAYLTKPDRFIYWIDLILSVSIGWSCFFLAVEESQRSPLSIFLFIASICALYRSVLFIHEISHLKKGAVPGFELVWNLLIGIPLLIPSFFYTGVHLYHHRRGVYGTLNDPEYLPLAHQPFWKIASFIFFPLLAPILLALRFLVVVPLSFFSSRVYRFTVSKYSTLGINPSFNRPLPQGKEKKIWMVLEASCFCWVVSLLMLASFKFISWRFLLFGAAIGSMIAFVNQLRTLIAHRFQNREKQMTLEEQLLDSVNVPKGLLTSLWAPLGLRYHALHHYFPGLPYHSLQKAHECLLKIIPSSHPYHQTSTTGFFDAFRQMFQKEFEEENITVQKV